MTTLSLLLAVPVLVAVFLTLVFWRNSATLSLHTLILIGSSLASLAVRGTSQLPLQLTGLAVQLVLAVVSLRVLQRQSRTQANP